MYIATDRRDVELCNGTKQAHACSSTLCNTIQKHMQIRGWGCSSGKSFRFVRTYIFAFWLPSGIGFQKKLPALSLFLFWPAELSLSLLGATNFPFSLPPTPETSYPTSVGLIGYQLKIVSGAAVQGSSYLEHPPGTAMAMERYDVSGDEKNCAKTIQKMCT